MEKKIHQGHNIGRFRKMLGVKQDALAASMGAEWTQKKISLLEDKEEIDDAILQEVAKALKLPVEAIKNFDEEAAISIVANTFTDFKDNAFASAMNYQCSFNPIDKVIELYERIIKEKNEEIERLREKIQ